MSSIKIADMQAEYVDHMGSDINVVNADLTKTQKRIVEAKSRGYYVTEDGKLISPNKQLQAKKCGTQRYPTFSTNWGGVFSIPVHKFAAYCFYGVESFKDGLVVRHLNGDVEDFSLANIKLGTHSENNLDKSEEVRASAARKARASQGKSSLSAKLSEDDLKEIKDLYSNLNGKKAPNGIVKALCEKFGVSRTAIINVKNGVNYVY